MTSFLAAAFLALALVLLILHVHHEGDTRTAVAVSSISGFVALLLAIVTLV